jgi:hypothetical protein
MGNNSHSHSGMLQPGKFARHPHQRFGSALYCGDVMIVRFPAVSACNFKDWQRALKRQVAGKFALTPLFTKVEESAVCSESVEVEVAYPCYPICLTEEVTRRALRHKEFSVAELLYFLFVVCEASLPFAALDSKAGKFITENLLLSSQGLPAFITILSTPAELVEGRSSEEFLTPEESLPFSVNYLKSDSFRIGMLMLSLLLLEPSHPALF